MTDTQQQQQTTDVDVVVVGAGFAGLYLLHRLRRAGFRARVLEAADDVGGTWYWNRYPGARCDIPTTDYTFSFDPELEDAWQWSEKYATQPEILRYAQFVAERYGLRDDITFNARVTQATWDDASGTWLVETDGGERIRTRFHVMATGCLSVPKEVDIPGAGSFAGPTYSTGRWPHEGVDFTGKRVAVIGTGSSGIQSIPLIAEQAAQLTVFQRTANFSVPAHNGARPAEAVAKLEADRDAYRQEAKLSAGGVPKPPREATSQTTTPEQQRELFEAAWAKGELFEILGVLADQGIDPKANEIVAEMIREKIRSIVDDPEVAESLCPKDHYFGTKRPCLDTGYYATFNKPHVRLVDLKKTPIHEITPTGIALEGGEQLEFDAIVFATGFDAMTGALVGVDIAGRDGITLKEKWAEGPVTYLGLTTVGFPNLFTLTGPESPSVLSNMAVSIEQHVDWVADCIEAMRADGFERIEPTPTAEAGWHQHNADCGNLTLHPTANSWYMGANVPGKPRVMLPYIGGVGSYRLACDEVVQKGYLGFRLEGPSGERCNDGIVRQLQPDVAMVLEAMAAMGMPAPETMEPAALRELMAATEAMSPPGPEVGEVVDGTLPGAAGDLTYRLWRPATPGPHPLLVWFHGGGWVIGSATSDEPLCRDLCVRTDAVVISVDYRHAPEAVFPAAFDDAVAAVRWVSEHMTELGAIPGTLAVGGWSAGAGLTAAVAQHLRDAGGPALAFQFMLHPVTDQSREWPSMETNGEGYVLTRNLMRWFMGHYTPDASVRSDPRVSPLLGRLEGLPPAVLVTGQFDPLRDEGDAYAEALEKAGVPVTHIQARGHTHTSLTMVGVVLTGASVRAEIAEALRSHWKAPASLA